MSETLYQARPREAPIPPPAPRDVGPTPPEYWRPAQGLPPTLAALPSLDGPGSECRAVVVYTGLQLMDLAQAVMADHGVTRAEFFSTSSRRRIAYCRFDFWWRARRVRGRDGFVRYSMPQLGLWFCQMGRPTPFDHTTVLSGIRRWNTVRRAYLIEWIRRDNARMAQIHGRPTLIPRQPPLPGGPHLVAQRAADGGWRMAD